jgi:hypothetical protein
MSPADAPQTAQRETPPETAQGKSEKKRATAKRDAAWLIPGATYM